MEKRVSISVVNYLNSFPFIEGLKSSSIADTIELQLDTPSVCASKLIAGTVDIGLVPVAVLRDIPHHQIISNYCIGADGRVDSVLLVSSVPLHEIKDILLDNQSRTSVLLAQVLAAKLWKITPQWIPATDDFEKQISGTSAAVVIGDKTFALKNKFPFVYDLAEEWKKLTALPFVFACWVSGRSLPDSFISQFNLALENGLLMRKKIAEEAATQYPAINVKDYLLHKIKYQFDAEQQNALKLFLEFVEELRL